MINAVLVPPISLIFLRESYVQKRFDTHLDEGSFSGGVIWSSVAFIRDRFEGTNITLLVRSSTIKITHLKY